LIQLAFDLGKTVDELHAADETWIGRMMIDREARAIASATTEAEYRRRLHELLVQISFSK